MELNTDRLRRFIETVKTIGFWGRLFGWGAVKAQLVDAAADMQKLLTARESAAEQLLQQRQQIGDLGKDLAMARELGVRQEMELTAVSQEWQLGKKTILELEAREAQRVADYGKQVVTLNAIQGKIEADREKEVRAVQAAELRRLADLKYTWTNHQATVKQVILALCQKHTIEYMATVPFKGEPDNTIKIGGEFVVLDAKSPRGDDLTNFPGYLREQAEKVKKYTGEENVKKWVFFVVPENTLSQIGPVMYHLADYQVFIVPTHSLEPILLSLRKVEEYEFADQLSPEDRENICRILGKFAHLSKRRIQIDTYFIGQFLELARKSEHELPPEILDAAIEFERAEKLNPPVERRAKAIPIAELEKGAARVAAEVGGQGIVVDGEGLGQRLNELPLIRVDEGKA